MVAMNHKNLNLEVHHSKQYPKFCQHHEKHRIKSEDFNSSVSPDEMMQSVKKLIHKIHPSRPYVELKLEF